MTLKLYGLKNCDSCRQANAWLTAHQRVYEWHDLREDGVDEAVLAEWASRLGWENLLNRKSATWRALPETSRQAIQREKALALMAAHPALIKRPILVAGDQVLLGFAPGHYAALS